MQGRGARNEEGEAGTGNRCNVVAPYQRGECGVRAARASGAWVAARAGSNGQCACEVRCCGGGKCSKVFEVEKPILHKHSTQSDSATVRWPPVAKSRGARGAH